MHYDFDEIIERRGTYSIKWAGTPGMCAHLGLRRGFDENTIPLFTADMDFACPPEVVAALHRVVDHRIYGYTSEDAAPEYIPAVQRWFQTHYGWSIPAGHIVYSNGTVNALGAAVRAFTDPGDGVLITRPVYGPFTRSIEGNGRRVVNSPLRQRAGRYEMDFDDIAAKAADPRTRMFLLCSPHNPTGRVWTPEELARLSDICRENGVLLVSDEVHCDLCRAGVRHTPAPLAACPGNLVTMTAVNKTFNLAGLQCTNVVIADEALREKFRAALGHCTPTPFAIGALEAAYTQCDEWHRQLCAYLDATFDWALGLLAARMPWVKAARPEGTYVLWMDFSACGLSDDEIMRRIQEEANVIVERGTDFDPERGQGFVRICLSSPRPMLEDAFGRIVRAFADI